MNTSYILYLIKELALIGFGLISIFLIFISIFYFLFWLSKKIFTSNSHRQDIPTKAQGSFIFCIYLLISPFLVDIVTNVNEKPSITYKIARYHYTVNILSILDKIKLNDTNIAYFFRNSVFNQYINIKNSFDKDAYNAIGCFNDIDLEYERYFQNNSSYKEKYHQYNDKYLKELKSILKEYPTRNKTFYMLTTRAAKDFLSYVIPNRLILYPKLALSYLNYSTFTKSEQTIQELTDILKIYDEIYNQENDSDNYQYQRFKGIRNQRKFYLVYPSFINKYSKEIILMKNDIDRDNICSNTDIFDYYLKSLKYGHIEEPEIMHIIKEECKYF